jgi:hypothetical protein
MGDARDVSGVCEVRFPTPFTTNSFVRIPTGPQVDRGMWALGHSSG